MKLFVFHPCNWSLDLDWLQIQFLTASFIQIAVENNRQ